MFVTGCKEKFIALFRELVDFSDCINKWQLWIRIVFGITQKSDCHDTLMIEVWRLRTNWEGWAYAGMEKKW